MTQIILRRLLPLTLALGFLPSCAEPQRPYQFSTAQMARDPLEALAAALTAAGQGPIVVDPKTGTVHTRWIDTGVRNGGGMLSFEGVAERAGLRVRERAGGPLSA